MHETFLQQFPRPLVFFLASNCKALAKKRYTLHTSSEIFALVMAWSCIQHRAPAQWPELSLIPKTPVPFCTSTFSHHPRSPVTFHLKMLCVWSIKVFSAGPVPFDVHVVLISKGWFGLYEEINSAEPVHRVKNSSQMQNCCDPSSSRMISGYEINQLQNQSCSLQTLGVSSKKGHIHQRLPLRVKESIWLQTGAGGGEEAKEGGKGGKFQRGKKLWEKMYIWTRVLHKEVWMIFPEMSPTDSNFVKCWKSERVGLELHLLCSLQWLKKSGDHRN